MSGVQFLDDGAVVVQFMDTATDVRNRELLVMSHQLLVRPGQGGRDYAEEIEDVRYAAQKLLADVMQDWETTTDVGVVEGATEVDDD